LKGLAGRYSTTNTPVPVVQRMGSTSLQKRGDHITKRERYIRGAAFPRQPKQPHTDEWRDHRKQRGLPKDDGEDAG
jgi:hypothetical protein